MIGALVSVIGGLVRLAPVAKDAVVAIARALRGLPARSSLIQPARGDGRERAPGELTHADAERQASAARNAGP